MEKRNLPREAEVVVVGGGCMGASLAFHLARRDMDVVLVEKDHVAAGATGHSGALVRQHYEARIGIRLARESLAFFQRFEKETDFDCDFRRTGFLSGAREPDLPAFDALLELLRSEGVQAERLAPSEAKAMEPQLEVSDYAAVVHDPDAGYADPIATAHGFATAAAVEGAKVFDGHAVASIGSRYGRVSSVKIRGKGALTCERVVVAAGNWTPDLIAPTGPHLPVRYVRGDVAILRRPLDFGPPPKIHFDFYGNTYSRPEGEKDTLCGFMDTDPRKTMKNREFVETIPVATVRDLRRRLAKRFPGMAVAEIGRLLSEFVATGRRPEPLEPLRAARFEEGRLVRPDAPFPRRRKRRLP
jgi:sarcosine oxidase subunit beta